MLLDTLPDTTEDTTPSDRWLVSVADLMPPLTGPQGTAERLLLHLHYGIDWTDGWVTKRRNLYWDRLLPDRVVAATYRSDKIRRWWRDVAHELEVVPRGRAHRVEIEALLRPPDDRAVLEVLRYETEPLLLRTRIVTEAVREHRLTHPTTAQDDTPGDRP